MIFPAPYISMIPGTQQSSHGCKLQRAGFVAIETAFTSLAFLALARDDKGAAAHTSFDSVKPRQEQ